MAKAIQEDGIKVCVEVDIDIDEDDEEMEENENDPLMPEMDHSLSHRRSLDNLYQELQEVKNGLIQLKQKDAAYFAPLTRTNYDYHMGLPSDSQLQKICQMTGVDDWDKSEWFVFTLHASDNLVSRSYRKWSINVLQKMEAQLKGKAGMLDHSWDESDKSYAFILDTILVREPDAPASIVNQPAYAEYNRKIIQKEGFYCLYATMAVDAIGMSNVVRAIKTRRLNGCSTGGLIDGVRLICPNCSEEYGREVSFIDLNEDGDMVCPHMIPNGGRLDAEEDAVEYADYMVMDAKVFDGVELSLTNSPNLPSCMVCRDRQ